MGIDETRRILEFVGARYALIGAHRMAARGYPRSTVDVDFLTADQRVLDPAITTQRRTTADTLSSAATPFSPCIPSRCRRGS
jgi:hypothetical protein